MKPRILAIFVVGVGSLFIAAVPAAAQVVEYYQLDALGNVRVVTDQAGHVLERHDYLPYGEECTTGPCATNPGAGAGQPKKFTGKERDTETGLDYFGARYHSAPTARFTTVDPVLNVKASLFNPHRWNRYAYALSNPLRFNDPDGREVPVVIDNKLYNMGLDGMTTGTIAEGNRAFAGLILGTTTALFGPEILVSALIGGQGCLFSGPCLGAVQEMAEGLAGGPPRPSPASTGRSLAAAERELGEELVANAGTRAARRPATMIGAASAETGEAIAGRSVPGPTGCCAEVDAAQRLGGDPSKIVFTKPVRPRTGEIIPVCKSCQLKFDRSQFPPGTPME